MGLIIEDLDMLPENLRAQAARKLAEQKEPGKKKRAKYKSEKCEVAGIVFDSRKEAGRFIQLKDMLRRGEIRDLKLQHTFVLQEPYMTAEGEKVGRIEYRADFTYYDREENFVIEDVKSHATKNIERYKLKKKMMAAKGFHIIEV